MINKKNLWFLTLFSLILVLSVYYITMPSELLLTDSSNNIISKDKKNNKTKKVSLQKNEVDAIEAMRLENEEAVNKEIEDLQVVIQDEKSTTDEKNNAYNKMKEINDNTAVVEKLQKKLKDDLKIDAYIKIDQNGISVTVNEKKHDVKLANKIIRAIQSEFDDYKYITVKFQN